MLPKYGFPTDTVELRTAYSGDPVGRKLELSRDLSAAIYEYAPGAEVVAGGKLWTSGGVYRLPDRELLGTQLRGVRECSLYREADATTWTRSARPAEPSQKGCQPSYWMPQFGFVASRARAEPRHGRAAAELAWGDLRAVARSRGVRATRGPWPNGGTAATWAGERGRLIAISEGRNGAGFRICEWCGWGTAAGGNVPAVAPAPAQGRRMLGPLAWKSLAHPYETDLLEITFDSFAGRPGMSVSEWRSVLYALLEGASDCLDISRDDIDGTLYPKAGRKISLVLFDTVPGGAGGALRIARSFPQVMATALQRMARLRLRRGDELLRLPAQLPQPGLPRPAPPR